ncbi:thioesterase II family protein [Streptomyces sp. CoT10]|uniref:thioesterase II family protein n=1 Tax=Streptomyces sp. CoT10 TaxID=2875762 RepID=UPI001CD6C6FA|nr:alpha/beta fold hydrolase [Streptomyces sp. CoT10]
MSGDTVIGGTHSLGRTWLKIPEHYDGRVRLFCLPFAGGGAAAYRPWITLLADVAQVLPVHLPGRESRLKEAPVRDVEVLASLVADALAPWCHEPYAVYGHSMGALLAHRTVAMLCRRGLPLPTTLFVAARRPPHMPPELPLVHRLPVPQLVAKLRSLGATPDRILEDPALLDLFLPTLRADFELGEAACLWGTNDPLPVRVVAMGGDRDGVRPPELAEWRLHTSREFSCRMIAGGHFFHLERPSVVTGELRTVLADSRTTYIRRDRSGRA